MLVPNVGTRVATLVAEAIEKDSGPIVAKRAGLGSQALYNYRNGRLPMKLALRPLAKGLRVPVEVLEKAVAADRRDRKASSRAGAA